jgi:hypothetical protein
LSTQLPPLHHWAPQQLESTVHDPPHCWQAPCPSHSMPEPHVVPTAVFCVPHVPEMQVLV